MDNATLTTVTIISLLLAWAMAIIAWQRVRAERRRSDARLATLMSARPRRAASAPRPVFAAPARAPAGRDDLRAPAGAGEVRLRRIGPAPRRGDVPRRAVEEAASRRAAEREMRRGPAPRALSHLWRAAAPVPPTRPRWGPRAAAVVVATVAVAGASLAERTPFDLGAPGLPVELLSLDHRRQGDYLAVSGTVRNPLGGRGRAKLSVSATVFDRTGAVIGTGQTPLPVEGLPPGGETAFTIALPDADRIDRYRVSFMEDRSRLPHVDRRVPDAATLVSAPRP